MTNELSTVSAGSHKLLSWKEKLDDWKQDKSFTPVGLEIHPSERCNHNCPDCQAWYAIGMRNTRLRAQAGWDLDVGILESVWEDPPPGIVLSGNTGDPLMNPDFVKLLRTIQQRAPSTKVLLITNGQGFTYESIEAALDVCQAIRVSIDADGPKMYRMTHGTRADWDTTMRNLQALTLERKMSNADCTLGIGFLTDKRTKPGMLSATMLARELGVDHIHFRPFHHRADVIATELEQCRQLEDDNFRVLASTQKYDFAESYERRYTSCQGANFVYLLDARGHFYMCCHHVGNPAARLGSLNKTTWREFIHSEQRRRKVNEFDVSGCMPLCRLDPHNQTLHDIQLNSVVPDVSLPQDAEAQRCFL